MKSAKETIISGFEICPQDSCTGCMACKAVCGRGAIEAVPDSIGFLYPKIDGGKCVECGLCRKVCPTNFPPLLNSSESCFAVADNSEGTLHESASGGVASLLAESVIIQGGSVYGCTGEDIDNVHYIAVHNIEDLRKLKGSKYLQCNIGGIYSEIRRRLLDNQIVLFIGIPCQTAGVKKFLGKLADKLITVDTICHGAANQQMVSADVEYCRRKFGIQNLKNVKFRNKFQKSDGTFGIKYGLYFESDSHKQYALSGFKDPFTLGYATNLLFRDSCYQCRYTRLDRVSDITIGDFWNLPEESRLNKSNGVSIVLPHTDKGKELLRTIESTVTMEPYSVERGTRGNPQLLRPTTRSDRLEKFREDLSRIGFVRAVRKSNWLLLLKIELHKLLSSVGVL